ncbi:MAG: hypothetical protein DIKNOCCD_00683 [bacterium]|nr:hypothetical protein [bacterium]
MGDCESPKGTGTFGMHPSFGNDFTIEMGQFLQKPYILQQHRAMAASCHNILVVDDWCASCAGQFVFLCHGPAPFFARLFLIETDFSVCFFCLPFQAEIADSSNFDMS